MSKKSIAAAVFATLNAEGKSRKEIMEAMIEKAGLSKPGASTYFHNFSHNVWNVDGTKAVELPKVDFSAMSNKQLVDFYNERSDKKIVKFRDHATAVKRCEALAA